MKRAYIQPPYQSTKQSKGYCMQPDLGVKSLEMRFVDSVVSVVKMNWLLRWATILKVA